MNLLTGLLVFFISMATGMYLDLYKRFDLPAVYWLIGVLGGLICGILASYHITCGLR